MHSAQVEIQPCSSTTIFKLVFGKIVELTSSWTTNGHFSLILFSFYGKEASFQLS